MFNVYIHKILLVFLILIASCKTYSQWVKVEEVSDCSSVLAFDDIIIAGANDGIYRSTDIGISWSHTAVDNPAPAVIDLSKNKVYIFAGTMKGVYSSADTGKTWISLGPSFSILSVYAKDSTVFACIHGGGLFRSENNGRDWIAIDGNHYYSYMHYNDKIFAGTFTGVYVSTDKGANWDFADLPNKIITSISKNDRYFFAVNYTYGLYRSDDYGISWAVSNHGLPFNIFHPYTVFAADSLIFAGLSSNKIYLSTDNGMNWQDFSEGIYINEETYNIKFAISKNKIFVSFLNNSLWYRDLSEITGITKSDNNIPDQFILYQNYPNPFNPNTSIKFSITSTSLVKLKVYDSIGQLIEVLVNRKLSPGYYSVNWNASKYSSGVYYYRLESNKYSVTKKCILLK